MKMRKLFVLFLLFSLLLSFAAHADVAYTPRDDFYETHYRECQGHERFYYANGSEGYVEAYSSPTGEVKTVIPNGREHFVSVLWEGNGKQWGCIEYFAETLGAGYAYQDVESAWVDMSSMYLRYDSRAFMDDYADEIRNGMHQLFIAPGDSVIVYRYPGSGIISTVLQNWSDTEDEALTLNSFYTDAEGREWGYVGYYFGRVNAWVCISDLYTELPAGAEYREPELIPAADEETLKNVPLDDGGLGGSVIAGAVGVLLIAAAVIVYIVLKKRREKQP